MLHPSRHKGFTLIEVIVVIALLGLLLAYIAPEMFGRADDAKRKAAGIQLEKVSASIDLYKLEVGRYPESLQDLLQQPASAKNWKGPYLKKRSLLQDPWSNELVYRYPGEHGRYDLLSHGSDGQLGGDEDGADITSWE